jgi:hypothetical protein
MRMGRFGVLDISSPILGTTHTTRPVHGGGEGLPGVRRETRLSPLVNPLMKNTARAGRLVSSSVSAGSDPKLAGGEAAGEVVAILVMTRDVLPIGVEIAPPYARARWYPE